MERTVIDARRTVCRDLTGHGIGRRIHEDPNVPNHYVRHLNQPLTDGLVITVEPIISAGTGAVHASSNGWTVHTTDGALRPHGAHHRHPPQRSAAPDRLTNPSHVSVSLVSRT